MKLSSRATCLDSIRIVKIPRLGKLKPVLSGVDLAPSMDDDMTSHRAPEPSSRAAWTL